MFPLDVYAMAFQRDRAADNENSVPRGTRATSRLPGPRGRWLSWLLRILKQPIPNRGINGASGHVPITRYVPPETSLTHRSGIDSHKDQTKLARGSTTI